jgi:Tol biopolymer transport system component
LSPTKYGLYVIPALGGLERKLLEGYAALDPDLPGPFFTWSPDAKWIIGPYRDSPKATFELHLISPDTGEHHRLISPDPRSLGDSMPSFSADGKTLAFCRASVSGNCAIYLVRMAQDLRPSGDLIRLTSDDHFIYGLDFTADGREVIFSSDRAGKFALWRIPATAGAIPQPIALLGEDAFFPRVARHGGRLVYGRRTGASTIWRVPLSAPAMAATPPGPFVSSSRNEDRPQFSPDGRKVAFASDRSGSWEIWLADADGSNATQLTSFGPSYEATQPAWSPGSDRVVFRVLTETSKRREIYWMAISGGQAQKLTDGIVPYWSRDGNWIYFASELSGTYDRNGSYQVWKISPGGGPPVQVTRHGGIRPMESPDAKFVYFTKDWNGLSLWRIPAAGGEEGHVLDIKGGWSGYTLAGDGIYYITGTLNPLQFSPQASIEFFRPSTGVRKHIVTIEKALNDFLSISPDGQFLLYTRLDRQTNELMLVENFR